MADTFHTWVNGVVGCCSWTWSGGVVTATSSSSWSSAGRQWQVPVNCGCRWKTRSLRRTCTRRYSSEPLHLLSAFLKCSHLMIGVSWRWVNRCVTRLVETTGGDGFVSEVVLHRATWLVRRWSDCLYEHLCRPTELFSLWVDTVNCQHTCD